MADKPIGIKDVAAAAGVSVAAVSLALRGKGRLSDATRERIQAEADRLGYRPHAAARSLAGDRTFVLAISLPEIAELPVLAGEVQHFLGILGGAAGAALEAGHLLTVAPGEATSRAWRHVACDGAVVVDPADGDGVLELFRARGTPVATIGRDLRGSQTDLQVDNDVPAMTRDVLDQLAASGARRIAIAVSEPLMSIEIDTVAAYRAWCEEGGHAVRVGVAACPLEEDVARAAREVLDPGDRPDAVYATIDVLAVAMLEEAARRGISVPDELQVITLSDSAISRQHRLSTVDERPAELGARAIELLADHLAGEVPSGAHRQVAADLIQRDTTRAG